MPGVTPWYQGAQVPLTWVNTDTYGNPQDAEDLDSITVTVTQPDQTTATPDITRTGTGAYAASPPFTAAQAGHHVFTWVSTDPTYPGTFTDTFEVQPVPDLTIVSLAEAKEILHQTSTSQYDAKIQGYNGAVTNVIEYYCGPCVQRTVIEKLPARGTMQALSKPPVLELAAWTEPPPALANAGIPVPVPPSPMFPTMFWGVPYPLAQLYCDPHTGVVTHTSGLPFIYGSYVWQYKAGRKVIPWCIYEASKIILKHLYYVEAGGTGTGTGAGDSEATIATPFGFAIPNRAYELMTPEMAASRMVAA